MGNVLLLLRGGEQGRAQRGEAHPSSSKWKDVKSAMCSPICSCGELLCVDSSPVPAFHFVALLMLTLFPTGLCLT